MNHGLVSFICVSYVDLIRLDTFTHSFDSFWWKVKITMNHGLVSCALFELPIKDYENPVLVSGADGVGTKLKLADQFGIPVNQYWSTWTTSTQCYKRQTRTSKIGSGTGYFELDIH